MRFLFWGLLLLYTALLPAALCTLFERRPDWFRGLRLPVWIAGLSLGSWCGVVGALLLPCWCGFWTPRGPELVFALLFGWLYLWIAGAPVFLLYGALRLIRRCAGSRSGGSAPR